MAALAIYEQQRVIRCQIAQAGRTHDGAGIADGVHAGIERWDGIPKLVEDIRIALLGEIGGRNDVDRNGGLQDSAPASPAADDDNLLGNGGQRQRYPDLAGGLGDRDLAWGQARCGRQHLMGTVAQPAQRRDSLVIGWLLLRPDRHGGVRNGCSSRIEHDDPETLLGIRGDADKQAQASHGG